MTSTEPAKYEVTALSHGLYYVDRDADGLSILDQTLAETLAKVSTTVELRVMLALLDEAQSTVNKALMLKKTGAA